MVLLSDKYALSRTVSLISMDFLPSKGAYIGSENLELFFLRGVRFQKYCKVESR